MSKPTKRHSVTVINPVTGEFRFIIEADTWERFREKMFRFFDEEWKRINDVRDHA